MPGRQHFVFAGGIGGDAPAQGQISWNPGSSTLVFSNDADPEPDGFIYLMGGVTPNASWFML